MRKPKASVGKGKNPCATKALSIPRLTSDYYAFAGGEQLGPMTIRQLADAYWDGRINEDDQYWTSGLTEWRSILGLFRFCDRVVLPPGQERVRSDVTSPSSGLLSQLFSRIAAIVIPPKPAVVVRPEGRFPHCSYCNGPAIPRLFFCEGCDSAFCRVCMAEMCEALDIDEGCPICRASIRIAK